VAKGQSAKALAAAEESRTDESERVSLRKKFRYLVAMTPAEFKKKWARYSGKETAAYQEHFNDVCALLGQPTPATADPTGSESFCFQKRVVKDAELFALEESDRVREEPEAERERGFADVWKKGCFAWEYKGKKKNLDAAYQQLLRYRESLLNPPLLVVCDFDRYIVRTNFNGTVQETMSSQTQTLMIRSFYGYYALSSRTRNSSSHNARPMKSPKNSRSRLVKLRAHCRSASRSS